MSKWNINPEGVGGVLETVAEDNRQLGKALSESNFTSVVSGLDWGAPITSVVPMALGNLFTDQEQNLKTITNTIAAGTLGVLNATLAYNRGHFEMAATFQSKMSETAEDGKFRWWEQHGYHV
ncbi:DUF6507 family protein [Georgenia alba]|uniref:DUF6507 family protein n=1 Tax=Georgenia alba TaxID=2233858 RepID=A0ABW2Q609_9MICO